jgi:hypothetical protein
MNPCTLPALLMKEPTISPLSLQPKGEVLEAAAPLMLTSNRRELLTEKSNEAVIIAIGIRPKAAHQVVVGDVATGRDGTRKGCRWNFYERRRTEGLSVESRQRAMLMASIICPEPPPCRGY